jgi:peptidoglycan LD-endopeptidase LytH
MVGMVKLFLWVLIIVILIAGLVAWLSPEQQVDTQPRNVLTNEWLTNPQSHPDWAMQAGERCGSAPFQFPTDGFIGYLWDDSFRPGHRHQGIDIFGGGQVGDTPVYAAVSGYLSRRSDWKSSVIVRIPDDPLHPGRQIWTYYTHMADADGNSIISSDFPPGTAEKHIEAGTLLGHQGNFSGTPGQPVGVHLHFSVVLDDGQGQYKNELLIANTLDPSPYLGIELNAHHASAEIPLCPKTDPGG